jgi:2-hydroxychromene-2-carboxylate isomerase
MTRSVDLFWSFRSPYSYLAVPRLVEIEATYDVSVNVRPVYPIAIRTPEFFKQINPKWPPYLVNDTKRVADYLGLPFVWPSPDPVVMDMTTLSIAADQPYIHRLTRLGIAAVERGRGLPFLQQISHTIFSCTKDWHEGDHLGVVAQKAGLDLAELDAVVEADPEHFESVIVENEAALDASGHWGVPTLVYKNEPFFGQDRIDLCVWRMQQDGLRKKD